MPKKGSGTILIILEVLLIGPVGLGVGLDKVVGDNVDHVTDLSKAWSHLTSSVAVNGGLVRLIQRDPRFHLYTNRKS